jgi:hypothetical protein
MKSGKIYVAAVLAILGIFLVSSQKNGVYERKS